MIIYLIITFIGRARSSHQADEKELSN